MPVAMGAESTYRDGMTRNTNGTHGDNGVPTSLFPRWRVGLVEARTWVRLVLPDDISVSHLEEMPQRLEIDGVGDEAHAAVGNQHQEAFFVVNVA